MYVCMYVCTYKYIYIYIYICPRQLRPDLEAVSLAEWFERNHRPGVSKYLKSLFTED